MQYHIISYHIISYRIISYHIIPYHIMWPHIISHHSISHHSISHHILSLHIISYHIISYHIISYHIISYHIIFPTAMQLGFNLWAWTWCNISRPRKSGTLGGGTGGACGTRCPGTFAFLEPKEFLEPVEPVKRMGFHRFQAFLGFKHAMVPQVPQVPHRFHTGSTQVPHRFLGFNQATGSTGSRQVSWVQKTRGSTGSMHSFISKTHWFHRVPDRFLGFKHAMVPLVPQDSRQVPWVQTGNGSTGSTGFQTGSLGWNTQWFHRFQTVSLGWTVVEGVNFGNCPNYVLLNAPLCRTIFEMGGDTFLTRMPFTNRNHATGSTGSRQVPWFHSFQTGSLGSNTQGFHRFHTGSLCSTRHWLHWFQTGSLGSTTPLVSQVPERFLGFNRGTVGIVEGVSHQTVVLFDVPLSINQQWEPGSLGHLVSHSSCLPIILEPCFLSFCRPSLCYYPILALFIFLSSIIISSYCPPLSLHLVSLRLVSHPFVAHYVIPIIIFSSCLQSSLHLDCPRASCLLVSCSPTSLCLVSDHPFVLSLS